MIEPSRLVCFRQNFPAIWDMYRAPILGFLVTIVRGPIQDAEDLLQEVAIHALLNPPERVVIVDGDAVSVSDVGTQRSLGPWLFTIARNAAYDFLRYRGRGVGRQNASESMQNELSNFADTINSTPLETAMDSDSRRALHARLDLSLGTRPNPEFDRRLIRLRLKEGWTFKAIAIDLGKTPGAVRTYWMRLLRDLA